MDITGLLIFLAIGALAGWLAGTMMKGVALALSVISSSVLSVP